ncbi:multicopper oxidase family protein [Actinomadura miaoliensis]|uniref:Multicopper oxidase family protein n=1 Tax=Actinomadura miaoliensis TaxID=430685 RepID=A0ABP7VPL5_9ACTN
MLSRRGIITLGAVSATGAAVHGVGVVRRGTAAAAEAPSKPFSRPLLVPKTAVPVHQSSTTDYYDMAIREASALILPGFRTWIFGYDGLFPGPTVRASVGRRVVIRQRNRLRRNVVVHLHGGLVAPEYDGHPADIIPPGYYRDYVYPNRQPSATLWYHDHSHRGEAEMVFYGLAGFYLLEDPWERGLNLPAGRYDIPLMLRDAHFDKRGQLVFAMDDRRRDTLLVNGRPQPFLDVYARRYRLRLLNGSNQRNFTLRLSDGAPMTVIASDGGLLPAPLRVAGVTLSPAERVDVVVDFGRYEPGTRVVLLNTAGTNGVTRNVMRFHVGRRVSDSSRVPDRLGQGFDLGSATVVRDVNLHMDPRSGQFFIDGRAFDMKRVDMKIRRGETEIWRVHNRDRLPETMHNLHLHGTHFQVLDRNGGPVAGHETGRKDTVAVPVGGHVRIKVRYDRHLGRYLYHCHLLDHSSMGMMAQAEIVG